MRSVTTWIGILAVAGSTMVGAPPAAAFTETVISFRSMEDASVPPDPAVCARAPFAANVRFGASLVSFQTRSSDGQLVHDVGPPIGTGTACAQITNPTFPPFAPIPFYSETTFQQANKPAITLAMAGQCTPTSNTIPVSGLILVACALEVAPSPGGTLGGVASSNTIFNPLQLPGFGTGSFWSVRLFSP